MLTAEIALPVPLPRTFTYSIPETFRTQVVPGLRVQVPFHHRPLTGIVLTVGASAETEYSLKSITCCLDVAPLLTEKDLARGRVIAEHYLCSLGEVLAAMIPKGVGHPVSKRSRSVSPTAILWPGLLKAESSLGPRVLEPAQEEAVSRIVTAVETGKSETFLLYGVTGSGKTEIYLRVAEEAVRRGTVLMLVPEIALTPQTVLRFEARFGESVGVWHSRLSLGQRARTWSRCQTGECRIVIGTRSTLMLPMEHVSLIILDEEHEPAYRQEDRPRYHAREVAIMRSRLEGCPVVLGSATPSLESWQAAKEGRFVWLRLPDRADAKQAASVQLIHRRDHNWVGGKLMHISRLLQEAIQGRLDRREQALLFLNRRGFATSVQCQECSKVLQCIRCDVALVWHLDRQKLVCHYCGSEHPMPVQCDQCQGKKLRAQGVGTERVEEEIRTLFPSVRVARLDADAVANPKAYYRILEQFAKHELDILIGTQMIAKGLHLPRVTLVGVVNADTALHLPDFRAAERTFQLLTQVAGRAGRGEHAGTVFIQTSLPNHYVLRAVLRNDPESFYREEMDLRLAVGYPPFTHLVRIGFQSRRLPLVEAAAQEAAEKCRLQTGIEVLGPAPAPMNRIRGEYRYHLLLKHVELEKLHTAVREVGVYDGGFANGVRHVVDVDPLMVL